jgi:hypothetical protein
MPSAPLLLAAADFDAYLPERGASKAYSRPRLELKQRALAWARALHPRLVALGLEVDLEASDEHPGPRNAQRVDAQHVVFTRAIAEREELDRLAGRALGDALEAPVPPLGHAWLGLSLDAAGVEVGLVLPPDAFADVGTLRARVVGTEPDVLAALSALPHEVAVVVGEERVPAHDVTHERLSALGDRAASERAPLAFAWRVGRDVALAHADVLAEELEGALCALGPLHRLVTWRRDDDLLGLGARLASLEDELARAHAERAAAHERWLAERKDEHARLAEIARARRAAAAGAPHRATLATLFGPPRAKKPAPSRAGHAPAHGVHPPAHGAHETPVAAPVASSAAGHHHAPGPLEKGARVRVLAGAFAGRVGVVSDLDGRGGARVLLGLLSARIELADLEPVVEGRGRPALHTSHTKVRG